MNTKTVKKHLAGKFSFVLVGMILVISTGISACGTAPNVPANFATTTTISKTSPSEIPIDIFKKP